MLLGQSDDVVGLLWVVHDRWVFLIDVDDGLTLVGLGDGCCDLCDPFFHLLFQFGVVKPHGSFHDRIVWEYGVLVSTLNVAN